jgi:crotonobetainyl-CoA:carnitine CoA-transferase CaiB-like acyl-CoA transferase
MKDAILKDLRILDFTRVLSGPFATRILGDFGAEVIKVQSKRTAEGTEGNLSTYVSTWNRNKRSITLDMTCPEAKALILRLVKISDVVVENFSPRVLKNWGLGYEDLKPQNSKLIMLSMSAMGQTGPWKDHVAFGPTLQSMAGLTYLTSFSEKALLGIGFSLSDLIAGLYGAIALLGALENRDQTGLGQHIDLSQYEAICTTIGPALMDVLANDEDLLPRGNDPDTLEAAPYGCYQCSGHERWCVIAVYSEKEWQAFCHVMGNPPWTRSEKFRSLAERAAHKVELDDLIRKWTIKREAGEVVDLLQDAGVPAGVVQNAEDIAKDPQLCARSFFKKIRHPEIGESFTDTQPIRLSDPPEMPWKEAPQLGEDNYYVFGELLGLSEREINEYITKGIIA